MVCWDRCKKKRHEMKPGEILDQVISQSSSSANKCLLYKLANYKRGGELIDSIAIGGHFAVESLIREQFGIFMYNSGKGQIINRAEYLRWKYMENTEVTIPIEASLSPHDPLGKWFDHKACWQMQYRGSLGESLLHVLIICDTKVHTKLARILLRVFPMLALDVLEGEEYLGCSSLHLAIAYSNNELVQDLIDSGANINQRAIGSFFLPRDQQGYRPARNTDYEGLAYLGEYPLAWAACCANESVYNLLVDIGADPDAQDTFGNMILHMVVVCDKLDMFGYALRHPKHPSRNGIVNLAGLTPLTLACQLGRAEVFREMLELSSREFWRYSNITCSGYPLNALDTLLPDGRTNWNSALFIILNGTKEEHLDMLDGGIIQRLLEEKWKTFARKQFLKRLLILFIHLFSLSLSVYLRPARGSDNSEPVKPASPLKSVTEKAIADDAIEDEMDVQTVARYCSEVATLVGVLSYVIFQQGDEVKNQGLAAFLKQLAHTPAKAIFLISNFLILACIPFRIMDDIDTEEAILVVALPCSWFLLMFFAGAIRLTGPFVTMIYSMVTGDMFTFGIIYSIVLFGFSQAFYFLYKGHPQVKTTLFHSYPTTWMALFQTTLGDYNYSDLNNTTYPNMAKTVFVIFMIFVPILLLNMLIAMMGNTYAHVIEQSEKEWMKQWAKIVVTLERAVAQTDAQKYLEEYSIALGPSNDDSGYEQRGVMVIKSKSKTRAKQRKGALSNWKRVGRVTLNELKKRGMTGEELRRIMWGRSSISSPTRAPTKKNLDMLDPFSGAVGVAVDVMSFAQDIVMGGSDTKVATHLNPVLLPRPATTKDPAVMSATTIPPVAVAPPAAIRPHTPPPVAFKDPLRELVLMSEGKSSAIDNSVLIILAQAAAVLDYVAEVCTAQQSVADGPTRTFASEIGGEIDASFFTNPKDTVDPEKERLFLKQLEALDESDSEEFGERPVLGKISLIRRAKSAVLRSASAHRRKINEHPLFQIAWEDQRASQNGGCGGIAHTTPTVTTGGEPMCADEPATKQQGDKKDGNNTGVTVPIDEDEMIFVEDVRNQMALFHVKNRHRSSLADSDSGGERKRPANPSNVITEQGRHRKHSTKQHRRSTAKPSRNKVSPVSDADLLYERRRKSAHEARQPVKLCRSESPPDPLEPWSTRGITNMSKILNQ